MVVLIGLAVGLILAGILMAIAGKRGLEPGILATVVHVVGVVLIVVGLFLLLTPVAVWITSQLKAMLDLH